MRLIVAIARAIDTALAAAIDTAFGITNPLPKPRTYVEPEPDTGTYDPYAASLAAPKPDPDAAPHRHSGCCY